jgi:hypothetical protein
MNLTGFTLEQIKNKRMTGFLDYTCPKLARITENYKNGEIHGQRILEYKYQNPSLVVENYKNGKRHGPQISYSNKSRQSRHEDNEDRPYSIENYKNGNKHGDQYFFYDIFNVLTLKTYKNGVFVSGVEKRFTKPDDRVIEHRIYDSFTRPDGSVWVDFDGKYRREIVDLHIFRACIKNEETSHPELGVKVYELIGYPRPQGGGYHHKLKEVFYFY